MRTKCELALEKIQLPPVKKNTRQINKTANQTINHKNIHKNKSKTTEIVLQTFNKIKPTFPFIYLLTSSGPRSLF